MHRLLFACLFCLACSVQAGVYTYIDADGNRVFTDQPPSGNAKRLEMAPSNAMPPPGPSPYSTPDTPQPPAIQIQVYQLLRILIPEPDATLRIDDGKLIVTLISEPSLLPEHRYRLLLDGTPVNEGSRSPVFPLENVERGTHQLSAEIIDANGRIIERTPSQPFHIRQTTLSDKRRNNPCQLDDYGVRPECPLKDKPEPPSDIPFVPFI
ncbi:DUF4124 domain-containing protein [Pseudomonas sp. LRF_L74]|uniref:DUF4124 domain-containing protein n=1 Tax=Pseudomonas sp. LRF_L74 TaxID=3369422 RepID=UPI003F612A6C